MFSYLDLVKKVSSCYNIIPIIWSCFVSAHHFFPCVIILYQSSASFPACISKVGRDENVIGWYHSHPGYGCWMSGVDVATQLVNQEGQDPFLAIVVSMMGPVLVHRIVFFLRTNLLNTTLPVPALQSGRSHAHRCFGQSGAGCLSLLSSCKSLYHKQSINSPPTLIQTNSVPPFLIAST